ncbi:hypothetical protein Pla8534_37690 [Lignipirellula cremea]|uniref:Uncharacterized protein n=1 Tax=Lignipirellula cremea TaxID=2528010 RepID=A0A518DVT4_9BACT|nr:hypothetical protein Pla8534_37690 [Lignipirellula cremea]
MAPLSCSRERRARSGDFDDHPGAGILCDESYAPAIGCCCDVMAMSLLSRMVSPPGDEELRNGQLARVDSSKKIVHPPSLTGGKIFYRLIRGNPSAILTTNASKEGGCNGRTCWQAEPHALPKRSRRQYASRVLSGKPNGVMKASFTHSRRRARKPKESEASWRRSNRPFSGRLVAKACCDRALPISLCKSASLRTRQGFWR